MPQAMPVTVSLNKTWSEPGEGLCAREIMEENDTQLKFLGYFIFPVLLFFGG